MNSSTLVRFLKGEEEVDKLKKEILKGVDGLRKNLSKKGSSSPIYVDNDVKKFVVKKWHIQKLCDYYLNNNLDEVELCYLATAIELCGGFVFESEDIEDAIVFISSDPDPNHPLSKEELFEVIENIG
jgi:hypothetical protein